MDTSNYYYGLNNNHRHHNNMGSSSITQAAAAAAAVAAGMIGIGNNNNNNNNTAYGNCDNYVNSNNYGFYNNQQQQQQQQDNISCYMPNYYPIDNNNDYDNIGQQYHQRIDQHQMTTRHYYEPIFRPPPTSCYAHSYSRHNVDPNPSFIAPPPGQPLTLSTSSTSSTSSSSASSQSVQHVGGWYQQQQQQIIAGQYEQTLNMLQYSNSNGREARNKAEKNRRDKLNGSIQELSTMVPHVAESPRRVDKTAVLRFSAHGLRIHYVFGKTVNKQPAVKSQVTDALMRLLDSFLLSITCRGQIVLISPSIEQHLGHCQTDLFGQNILHITHPDDHIMLKKQLIPTDIETLFDIQPEDENGEPRPRTQEEEEEIDRKLREDRRNFTVRLARAGPRSEPTTYEIVKIDGCFRRADSAPRGVKSGTFPSGLQLVRRARGRDDSIPLHSISGNDVILVAMARVIKPPKICDRLIEANHYEYKTRHLIDGRIIQCDQRISLVAGYMTEEVNGLSPFTFMHQDDVRWVIVALRQMYDCNSAYGESCYRLITRTGKFIYLRTRGYLEIDKDTNKVHSFVCINTLVTEDEGRRRVQEMKNKFSIIINTQIPPSAIDAPASENPHQLEKAVIYLIKNLRKCDDDDDGDDEDDDDEDDGDGVEISSRGSHHGGSESDSNRQSKTPPLALIPPKTCTIKSSISKSVNVVNMSVAKGLKAQQSKSPSSASESDSGESIDMMAMSTGSGKSIDNNSNSDGGCCINTNENQYSSRPSVVRKNGDNLINANENIENRIPPLPNSKDYFETKISNNMQQLQQHQHDQSSGSSGIETATTPRGDCMYSPISSIDLDKPSPVLKRSRTSDDFEDDTDIMIKRRNLGDSDFFLDTPSLEEFTDPNDNLTQILSSDPFDDIEQSLTDIESATTDLTDQCCSFDIGTSSSTSHRLNDILSEQQEQREILESIQNEYNSSNLLHHHNTSSSIDPRLISPKDCKTNCGLQNSGDFKKR